MDQPETPQDVPNARALADMAAMQRESAEYGRRKAELEPALKHIGDAERSGNRLPMNGKDWDVVLSQMEDGINNDRLFNTSDVALKVLPLLKNDHPYYATLWKMVQSSAAGMTEDGLHDPAVNALSDAIKLGERHSADSRYAVPEAIQKTNMQLLLKALHAQSTDTNNILPPNPVYPASEIANLLLDPSMRKATDTEPLWKALRQYMHDTGVQEQAFTTGDSDERTRNMVMMRGEDVRLAVEKLDDLRKELPAGDVVHRQAIDHMLKDDMYPAAKMVRQDYITVDGGSRSNWDVENIIGRFENAHVSDTPTKPTPVQKSSTPDDTTQQR